MQNFLTGYADSRSRSPFKCNLPFNSCLLHISHTLCMISIKHHPIVPLSETMCRAHDSATQTKGQGYTSGHVIYPSNRVHLISPEPFDRFSVNFTQLFFSVRRCAEPMTQLHRLNFKVIQFTLDFVSTPYHMNPLNNIH